MNTLIGLYEAYFEQVRAAQKRLRPADGLLGMGERLENAPCHEAFFESLRNFLGRMDAGEQPEQVFRVLDTIYRAPFAYPDVHTSVYWMLIAVQGLTREKIGLLCPQDAQNLYLWYQKAYPRRERLPVQDQVLEALQRRGRHNVHMP